MKEKPNMQSLIETLKDVQGISLDASEQDNYERRELMTLKETADFLFKLLLATRTYRDVRLPTFIHAGEQILFGLGLFFGLPRPEQLEIAMQFDGMELFTGATNGQELRI